MKTRAPDETASPLPPQSLLGRVLKRLRYGILIHEVLVRCARCGLVFYPYYIYSVSPPSGWSVPLPRGCALRDLSVADVPEIERLLKSEGIGDRIEKLVLSGGVGIFHDGRLCGYIWENREKVHPSESYDQMLFPLEDGEAYRFGAFVAAPYRGKRFAEFLIRNSPSPGIRRIYSAILASNRSSMRLASRVGGQRNEMRLYVHLRIPSLAGWDVRLWGWNPHPGSPRLKRIPPDRRKG